MSNCAGPKTVRGVGVGTDASASSVGFARIPAKKSILLFDTCQSGTLTAVASGGVGAVLQELGPITAVTRVKTEGGWVLVAKEGTVLGYVPEASMKPLQ